MKDKLLIATALTILFIVFISVIFSVKSLDKLNNREKINNNVINNLELSKYRSEAIPEECRLPSYEDNVDSWKEHLSHHKETSYCLKYYE